MPSLFDSVDPRYLLSLVTHLEQGGHNCSQALSKAGITRAMLRQQRIPIASNLRATQELALSTGRSDLGFVRGLVTKVGTSDVATQLLLSAGTLRQALETLSPYVALISPIIQMQLRQETEKSGNAWLDLTLARPLPYESSIMALETAALSCHRQLLFTLQVQELHCEMEFSWSAPAHADKYRRLRGVHARFGLGGQPRASLSFPAAVLDRPLPLADAKTLYQALSLAKSSLQKLKKEQSVTDWVEYALTHVEDQKLTQECVARLLLISSKTLARHLAREQTSFGDLSQKVRQRRAEALLRESGLSVGEISHKLGFATLANFSRSFKAKAGMTPSEFRASSLRGT
ncbi:AraC family transcriptional regulator [Comamonas composti]|uniref:AraC family transcriptional regulator n=1 Tax=Comamonas composti TaxID=408558 RepID=UPI00040C304A|nr:AraC family transcriptional regulator [Comamonas composti]